jgi:hypothetical protein
VCHPDWEKNDTRRWLYASGKHTATCDRVTIFVVVKVKLQTETPFGQSSFFVAKRLNKTQMLFVCYNFVIP